MELQHVVSIVESLAAGAEPGSDVGVALTTAAGLLKQRETARPAAAGQRWSEEEDALLAHEFDGGMAVADIARQHGRTKAAITLRLVKLGRLDADTVKVRERG
jgi:hypothetical protein